MARGRARVGRCWRRGPGSTAPAGSGSLLRALLPLPLLLPIALRKSLQTPSTRLTQLWGPLETGEGTRLKLRRPALRGGKSDPREAGRASATVFLAPRTEAQSGCLPLPALPALSRRFSPDQTAPRSLGRHQRPSAQGTEPGAPEGN